MAEQSSEYSTSAVSLFKEKKLLIPSCVHRRLLRLSQLKPIQKVLFSLHFNCSVVVSFRHI